MGSILHFFDLNQSNSSNKFAAHKRQFNGNEAPRNSLEFYEETSHNCSVIQDDIPLPCGHNFCLKCFQKSPDINKGKQCGLCRKPAPKKIISEPRINSSLVMAIRLAKTSKPTSSSISAPAYLYINNANRPETAFTTERAKKAGKANACSGQIFVTIALDHFGPILADHDPKRNRGVLVGDSWDDRLQCRQYGAHFPHAAGIAGQCTYGAQSVALSGGYIDDEDHGEWFLYTGRWDADFYVKVDDDVHVNLGMLAATLARHRSKPRVYIGCMKSGPVLSRKNKFAVGMAMRQSYLNLVLSCYGENFTLQL